MMPSNMHECPMCYRGRIPIWRPLCTRCYSILPHIWRLNYSHAYRCRVVDPVAWQEKKVEGRQWFLGRNINDHQGDE